MANYNKILLITYTMQENHLSFDVLIVGGGPAGLSCAIELAKHQVNDDQPLSICLIDKGSEIGAHILSGNILDPKALDILIPNWREKDTPITTKATKDRFYWLTEKKALRLPTPPQMLNGGNYIMSLSQCCRWLAKEAEALGVMIIPGYAAVKPLYDGETIIGIETNEVGVEKDGTRGDRYQPGIKIFARQTVLAEGCYGFITEQVIERYHLRKNAQPQSYAIGVKEVWRVHNEAFEDGLAIHTIGWPLDADTYGGSFIYHYQKDRIAIGLVIGLDFKNPYLNPHSELQRFKHHPKIKPMFEHGTCLGYGSRALNEGGIQAIPQLTFPGGVIVGCAAGFLNNVRIKGTHCAMQSGILAAQAIYPHLKSNTPSLEIKTYEKNLRASWIIEELHKVRNIRPGFYHGRLSGLLNAGFETLTFGHSPWTLSNRVDHLQLEKANEHTPPNYIKPDGVISFDKLTSVRLSSTNHTENQPTHLIRKDPSKSFPINYQQYAGPEARYCPANVYEYASIEGEIKLQINGQNCVHCKTCSIKDPIQNLKWVPPQGGEGPLYTEM